MLKGPTLNKAQIDGDLSSVVKLFFRIYEAPLAMMHLSIPYTKGRELRENEYSKEMELSIHCEIGYGMPARQPCLFPS